MIKGSLIILVGCLFLTPSTPVFSAGAASGGALSILVEDENGAPVKNAHVYVYAGKSSHLVTTVDCPDGVQLALPPGDYRVYAAAIRKGQDFVDHLISPNAQIELVNAEPLHVVLHLYATIDPLSQLTEHDLNRMGLSPELLKDLKSRNITWN